MVLNPEREALMLAHIKISKNAQFLKDEPAIIVDGNPISYEMLDGAVVNSAKWFVETGVKPTMVVALSLSDAVLQLYLTLAILRLGAIQATIDPRLRSSTSSELASKLGIQFMIGDAQPTQTGRFRTLFAPGRHMLERVPKSESVILNSNENSVAFLCHGSGTTGGPKIFALRHRQLLARCTNIADEFSLSPGERSLILQRHTTPTYLTRAMQSLYYGGCLIEITRMRNGAGKYFELLCTTIDEQRIDHLHCTAFHAKSIVNKIKPSGGKVRFQHLKTFLVGASHVSHALREHVIERATPNLCINYGTNEAGNISRASPSFLANHFDSVGRISPDAEISIIGTQGEGLGRGQEGIIMVRGQSVVDCYEGDEVASKAAFRDGWFNTGDMGYLSEDGALYVLGRSDDMMIIDGTNVHPAEIEKVIDAIDEVKESAVVGVYSDLGLDMIGAFVDLTRQCTESYIIAACRRQLGWKSPHQVFFVDSLPRNFAGKILRKELAQRLAINEPDVW
jgi:cyanophycin synthetase